ncbi:hsp70 family protein [Candidatus Protochlamydia phocaeensis]|uniref:hsp70 family protein n=1 Tax=Candidatus Protochlamydia phocaeensis TaxID=1414722 RepID=UPI00083832F6|nr:hsp70 family protein [Candidatus Protochlamydia phocaeensis]
MRYIIGIDLGTTNSSVAFIDTESAHWPLQFFSIPQLTALGKVDALSSLPSFCYLAAEGEWPAGSLRLPWKEETAFFVGQLAKIQGARVPTRLVQSAKSWLCNVAANRRDKILPVEAADLSQRLSPVEASSRYLSHLKEAWNATIAKEAGTEFEEQDILLTVPASFDEVARTLTIEAARLAGLTHVTLLEEPQAAFYSWISQHEKNWEQQFKAGESILVCDIGGGTTDFSLIEVQEKNGQLGFQRMAVGDHLLLGGDNMDVALAHYLENKLQQGYPGLESTQWLQLQAEARAAKEHLLQPHVQLHDSYSIVLQGTGSSVIKGSLATAIQRQELENLLVQGFFGHYPLSEALQLKKSRGFRTVGLPYEDEPSIVKHLAHFLQQARYLEPGKAIHYLLFNGGTMKPEPFQQAIVQALVAWFPQSTLKQLDSASLDLAVARGAAYYGKVRRGMGISIGGGLPRSYYLEMDIKNAEGGLVRKALTLLPRGAEEGHHFQPDQIFSLRPNRPVAFHLLTSHVRLFDREGEIIEIQEEEMQRLPPIQTILRFGRKQTDQEEQQTIPVRLGIRLTAVGTLELWVESQKTDHRWNLEFQLRSASGQDHNLMNNTRAKQQDETFEKGYLQEARQTVESLFQPSPPIKPNQIMDKLEESIGMTRRDWAPSVLRELWESLLKCAPQRKMTPEHEARWWNLAGFFLRPGFGFPLDDFRIKEMWKIILGDLKSAKSQECQIQNWICFRRIAGGLSKGQQVQIASELTASLFDKRTGKLEGGRKGDSYAYSEKIRALAALERIDLPLKIRLGEALLSKIAQQEADSYDLWALGRIGARHLAYGSVGQVVPKDMCAKWVEQLLKAPSQEGESYFFALEQLARKTDHRELNLPDALINQIIEKFPQEGFQNRLKDRILTPAEQEQVFGDRLPPGLILELV